ncbi:hypothetical protein BCR44DRAFT_1102784 [Catenaria anguillulae PL171]|uniref:Uncharacterized protein n=1 Tax=Catenaria anguillulae PL171 TaxID=765915 RepID=A0A1Y2I4L8_9FUNG|nr:hypothetical protein BCR44DRAFT_1102784 [Catenaria anguillulae PL171]
MRALLSLHKTRDSATDTRRLAALAAVTGFGPHCTKAVVDIGLVSHPVHTLTHSLTPLAAISANTTPDRSLCPFANAVFAIRVTLPATRLCLCLCAAAQGGLAPGAGLGKQRLWPPPNRSTHQSIHMRSSATPMPSNGPAVSPHAHVRSALDLSERTCASGGGAKEPVIRLGPSPRASSRPTLARRPPFLDSQQPALVPVPKMPAGSLGTATATADAVILPHHGHPHCSSTESGSPLVGVGMGTAYHWHRPIVLRELVSSLSPSPSPRIHPRHNRPLISCRRHRRRPCKGTRWRTQSTPTRRRICNMRDLSSTRFQCTARRIIRRRPHYRQVLLQAPRPPHARRQPESLRRPPHHFRHRHQQMRANPNQLACAPVTRQRLSHPPDHQLPMLRHPPRFHCLHVMRAAAGAGKPMLPHLQLVQTHPHTRARPRNWIRIPTRPASTFQPSPPP